MVFRIYMVASFCFLMGGLNFSVMSTTAHADERYQSAQHLKNIVSKLYQEKKIRRAHPDVAKRLSQQISKFRNTKTTIHPEQIYQIEFGSDACNILRSGLKQSIGVGVYPSKTWGHNKIRVGLEVADAVPKTANPFPSTGTKARIVPFESMHKRFYEAVFPTTANEVNQATKAAQKLSAHYQNKGTNCASFISEIIKNADTKKTGLFNQALKPLKSSGMASYLWDKALSAKPTYIFVYTPKGDFRSIENPKFIFDYQE